MAVSLNISWFECVVSLFEVSSRWPCAFTKNRETHYRMF